MASKKYDEKTMYSTPEVDEFMQGSLVTWFQSCLRHAERLSSYEDLLDGVLIHEVIQLIKPDPEHKGQVVPSYKDHHIRIRNMAANVRHVRSIYENELFQTILVCPDPVALAGGETEGNLEISLAAMHLMLLLLLGAAVQGPSKEAFIEDIKQLPLNCQHSIVDCIKQVTNSQELVLTQEWGEVISIQGNEGTIPELLATHVMRLAKERDNYLAKWTASLLGESECHSNGSSSTIPAGQRTPNGGKEEVNSRERARNSGHHSAVAIAVEVSEWKARVRRLRQELEERTETLAESREEAERFHGEAVALRRRVQELSEEARAGAAYRDEVDALRERAEQADRLEGEIRRYKERLGDTEFYRSRVEELREDNRVLLETKELLEEQLNVARRRAEKTLQVEGDLERARREIADLVVERDAGRERAVELAEEVARLRLNASAQWRQALRPGHGSTKGKHCDEEGVTTEDEDDSGSGLENRSLSEQLCSEAEARALRLELENSRLVAELEAKKEEQGGEMAMQINTLKGENKRLSMKVEQLQEGNSRWNAEREELETGLQEALMERRRLQNSLDSIKEVSRINLEEKQILQAKLEERDLSLREARLENQRLSEEVRKFQAQEDQKAEDMQKLRDQVTALQKEVTALLREISKLKEDLEAKEVSIEQLVTQGEVREEEMQNLSCKEEEMEAQIKRLQDVEREMFECQRKAMEEHDTLATLQSDLVKEKTERQILHNTLSKMETVLVRLGVDLPWKLGELETESSIDPDLVLDRIKNSAEIQKMVKEVLLHESNDNKSMISTPNHGKEDKETEPEISEQSMSLDNQTSEKISKLEEELCSLRSELKVAKEKEREATKEEVTAGVTQEVEMATLQSRIQSLTDQHTALHLANSQLVAEKEEMAREIEREMNLRKLLLLSQEKLDHLHNDLTADYECVTRERDAARAEARSAKAEAEKCNKAVLQLKEALQEERKTMHTTSASLANLRDEHSRLKDDFRWVYSITEKQKAEIKALKFKQRSSINLHHLMTKVGGAGSEQEEEISQRDSLIESIPEDAERARLEAECLMLREMNSHLLEERRSLMNHATRLLNECHGLFSHSLEDKQHFHKEERAFMDVVNDLKRQKEKLEEKIMELYRSAESSSSKKKSFGANLVKKVRKAGSDFISKVPKGGRSWNRDGRRSLSHSNVQLMSDVGSGSGGDEAEDDDLGEGFEEEQPGNDGEWDTAVPASADTDVLLPPPTLRLGGAGSRQGVYYTSASGATGKTSQKEGEEEEGGQQMAEKESCFPGLEDAGLNQSDKNYLNTKSQPAGGTVPPSRSSSNPPPTTQSPSGRSLLVYNRITANVGIGGGYNPGEQLLQSPPCHPIRHGRNSSVSPRSSPLPHDENEPQWGYFSRSSMPRKFWDSNFAEIAEEYES